MVDRRTIERIADFAATCDVFVVGEIHGTRQVPALCSSLLGPLRERGYRMLAMEIPSGEETRILAYARDESR